MQALRLSNLSLQIGGGIILFLIALRMIFPSAEGTFGAAGEGEPFLVPLAVPALAGPSAMATVMLLSAQAPNRMPEWIGAVSIAMGSVPFLGTEFMPKLDEGSILIETRKLPSISLPESVETSKRVEGVVRSFPEVRQVVTKIGRPDLATEAMGIYQGDVYVTLKPIDEWTTGRTKEGLIEALHDDTA